MAVVKTESTTALYHSTYILLAAQGMLAEAEALYQRSLAVLEAVLGDEHPDVATVVNSLAGLFKVQVKDVGTFRVSGRFFLGTFCFRCQASPAVLITRTAHFGFTGKLC